MSGEKKQNPKIVTKRVTKDNKTKVGIVNLHLPSVGWKVYINGEKYPKKPVDFYELESEGQAVMKAMKEWILDHREIEPKNKQELSESLFYSVPLETMGRKYIYQGWQNVPGTAEITDSCENPVVIQEPIKIRPTDRLFTDSPDAGDPACLCSRCGKVIEEGAVIRAWPDAKEPRQYLGKTNMKCMVCGCTDDRACPGGCSWVLKRMSNVRPGPEVEP